MSSVQRVVTDPSSQTHCRHLSGAYSDRIPPIANLIGNSSRRCGSHAWLYALTLTCQVSIVDETEHRLGEARPNRDERTSQRRIPQCGHNTQAIVWLAVASRCHLAFFFEDLGTRSADTTEPPKSSAPLLVITCAVHSRDVSKKSRPHGQWQGATRRPRQSRHQTTRQTETLELLNQRGDMVKSRETKDIIRLTN